MWIIYAKNQNAQRSYHTGVWSFKGHVSNWKKFTREAKAGDAVWFVETGTNGRVVLQASFVRCRARELGPLFNVTPTDEELGYIKYDEEGWDMDMLYENGSVPTTPMYIKQTKRPQPVQQFDTIEVSDKPIKR
jgi:hypothetical protein